MDRQTLPGWVGGWVDVEAGLRIANSNQKWSRLVLLLQISDGLATGFRKSFEIQSVLQPDGRGLF